jgi:hypothetical protein
MTNFVAHRINTIEQLDNIPKRYGVEIDVRQGDHRLVLSHDNLDNFDEELSFTSFLESFKHTFLIVNIKTDGIEEEILDNLIYHKIENYFLLDCSFPTIVNLTSQGVKNIAVRYSEYESIFTVLNMKDKVKWVWVDCFTKMPMTKHEYDVLKLGGFKICVVSPELQSQEEKIEEYRDFFIKNDIIPDMICTKYHNIKKWEKIYD